MMPSIKPSINIVMGKNNILAKILFIPNLIYQVLFLVNRLNYSILDKYYRRERKEKILFD